MSVPKKKSELEKISDIVALMRDSGVHSFKYKDLQVEFERNVGELPASIPMEDLAKMRIPQPGKSPAELFREETEDLLWSSNP